MELPRTPAKTSMTIFILASDHPHHEASDCFPSKRALPLNFIVNERSWKGLLDLNFPQVIPAVRLLSLDSQLDRWLPGARIQNSHSQAVPPGFEGVGHVNCTIKNGIAGQPLPHIHAGG